MVEAVNELITAVADSDAQFKILPPTGTVRANMDYPKRSNEAIYQYGLCIEIWYYRDWISHDNKTTKFVLRNKYTFLINTGTGNMFSSMLNPEFIILRTELIKLMFVAMQSYFVTYFDSQINFSLPSDDEISVLASSLLSVAQ